MRNTIRHMIITLVLALSTSLHTNAQYTDCLKVKIYSKSNTILFKDKNTFVVHFQLTNCGHTDQPLDFYANLGYKDDEKSSIFFEVSKLDKDKKYNPYNPVKPDYRNMVDSIFMLHPKKIYTFYLPLLLLYDINEPGQYRIQGFYRYKTGYGIAVQQSDYMYLELK